VPYKSKKLKGIQGGSLDKLTDSVVDLAKFTEDEFAQIATDLQSTEPDTIWNVAPPRPRRGTYAYADGTNWNPGFGEGAYTYNGTLWVPLGVTGRSVGPYSACSCGRLIFSSATQLIFAPFAGDAIKINGVMYSIPSAGVTASNGGLSASTVYYVYLWNNAGTLTIEFSTTGHTQDVSGSTNAGTEIKSGDASRSLVGMIRTNASSQFVDGFANRGVASWFNRRARFHQGSSVVAGVITNTAAWTEPSTATRVDGVFWGDDIVTIGSIGLEGQNDTAGQLTYGGVGLDGVANVTCESSAQLQASLVWIMCPCQPTTVGEGYHFMTVIALVSGGMGHIWGTVAMTSRG